MNKSLKYFLIGTIALLFSGIASLAEAHKRVGCTSTDPVVCQIRERSIGLDPAFVLELAETIHISAKKHKVPARTLTAILGVESSMRLDAVRQVCGFRKNFRGVYRRGCIGLDFGIAQVSIATAESYGFDVNLLTTDLAYSVDAGAEILGWFRQTYERREPDMWATRFNCGTRKNVETRICQKYARALKNWW